MVTRIKKAITVRGDDNRHKLGLVHIYSGDGKGKTTASLGLAMRALGNGYKVYIIQFLKSGFSGELKSAEMLGSGIAIEQFGIDAIKEKDKIAMLISGQEAKFVFEPDELEKEAAKKAMESAFDAVSSGKYEVVILDEVNCAIDKGLISTDEIKRLLASHGNVELVFTGRDAPEELYKYADYVSVVQRVKHPWEKGIKARKGIEY